MRVDLTHPTLDSIYSANENIKGMFVYLEKFMNKQEYLRLYKEYQQLAKKIPENEVLSDVERKTPGFGVDLKYTSLNTEIVKFEESLFLYNIYKELSDTVNEIKKDTENIFRKDAQIEVENYIEKNKHLMKIMIDVKNDPKLHQFTKLTKHAIETLFDSLKTLSFIGRNDLLNALQEIESKYLREHIGTKIRETIDTTDYKGNLDEDYLNESTIHECALQDKRIIAYKKEAREYEKKQKKLQKELEELKQELTEKLEEVKQSIQTQTSYLSQLKLNRKGIAAKKVLFNLTLVPLIAIPLSCPFIGHKIGKNLSSKISLTKTYTTTVDIDSGEVIASLESFEELNTSYVASVTIFEPWKKNISGSSYSRAGIVYDYVVPETETLEEDFHLTLDTIKEENLVKKYPYQQTTTVVENSKYLTEKQVYVTETYQDENETIPSTKYNVPFTVCGVGFGIILITSEILAYYLGMDNWIWTQKRKMQKALENNETETENTEKNLKLTLEYQQKLQQKQEKLVKINNKSL